MRILAIIMLGIMGLPLAAAESQETAFSVLTTDGKIEQGFFRGYTKGFFLLEQQQRILRLSPAHVIGVFHDRIDAEKATGDTAWLTAHLAMKPHPKAETPVDEPKASPEKKPYAPHPPPTPFKVIVPEGGSEKEKAFFAMLSPKNSGGMDEFYQRCLKDAEMVMEDYRQHETLKSRVRAVLPMLKGLDKHKRTMLDPETFRPIILVMTLISGHLRETFSSAKRDGDGPLMMKTLRSARRFQEKMIEYWVRHDTVVELSDLTVEEKEKARARAKQLGQSLKSESRGPKPDRRDGGMRFPR